MIKSPRGMSIMEAYELYRKNALYVNRRYQRKLVWSIKEKQSLIDSIIKKYPIPLILLAETDSNQYEIIDGMQRLNAIFSFIENQFGTEDNQKYFSVKDYTFAQSIADKKIFNEKIDVQYISQEVVSDFISYQFPVTIFESSSSDDINETFRRINANGKHLSAQEVRQAGNTSQLSQLVREISCEIRGDVSKDKLLLSEMPTISIDSKNISVGYGVIADDTFWCKQGILTVANVRDSEDEQFLADILISALLNQPLASSKVEFNNYYGVGQIDKANELEIKINAIGKDNISKNIKTVFSYIYNFCDYSLNAERLKNILNPHAGSNPVKEAFFTLFMSFYELIINQNKEPFDNLEIKNAIYDLHSKIPRTNNYNTTKARIKNINLTTGLIQNYFKKSESTFRSSTSYIIDFQNYLMKSKVESAKYDFKQGLFDLSDKARKVNIKTFEDKIIKNIAAMSNLGKGESGYLFLGVTDNEKDTMRVEQLDLIQDVPRYYGFGIVGLEREAKLKKVSLDEYISEITSKISESELPNDVKVQVTKSITPITYNNKTVLMIEIRCGSEPIYYKECMYIRDGAKCVEVKGAKQGSVYKLF
nr:DUF262 domain-containing protein [uncultured Aminipila sp.]